MDKNDSQVVTDLLTLYGYLKDREGFDPSFARAVAVATRKAFPKATLSHSMEQELNNN